MDEPDDRLAGDAVWELFPYRTAGPAQGSRRFQYGRWLVVACLVAACWLLSPSLAVATACLAIAAVEFQNGRRLARSIPDKAGAKVCARFAYAWGAWKFGVTAVVFMFATAILGQKQSELPPGLLASLLLCMSGYLLSATLTAAGLVGAYRSGMRVWVGEGVNRARTLLLAMLIVGFTVAVLGPICIGLGTAHPHAADGEGMLELVLLAAMMGLMFVGPIVMLLILDRFCQRVVADRPGKFGPKVPTVGKWS
jgi:hypothetical protein